MDFEWVVLDFHIMPMRCSMKCRSEVRGEKMMYKWVCEAFMMGMMCWKCLGSYVMLNYLK